MSFLQIYKIRNEEKRTFEYGEWNKNQQNTTQTTELN